MFQWGINCRDPPHWQASLVLKLKLLSGWEGGLNGAKRCGHSKWDCHGGMLKLRLSGIDYIYNVAKFKGVNLKIPDREAVILNHTKIKAMEVTKLPTADVNSKPPWSIKPKDKRVFNCTAKSTKRERAFQGLTQDQRILCILPWDLQETVFN